MNRAARWIAGFLILAAGVMLIRGCGEQEGGYAGQTETRTRKQTASAPGQKNAAFSRKATTMDPMAAMDLAHWRLLENPSYAFEILADLRTSLFQCDQKAAALAVSAFLRTQRDAPTGMSFAVGPDGVLAAVPTLRAALLNWHSTLDPMIALEAAREILKTSTSADEYALALRNLAWSDLEGDMMPELSAAFHSMLSREEWEKAPSAGYLESFDIAVALGDARTFQRLADFVVPDMNDAKLVRAASMSMDRMILRNPDHLTNAWNTNPQWMDRAPLQRASLFSRLDVTREDHRAVLLGYLSSDRMTPEERDYFEKLYPNGNYLHGHRLVTTNEKSPTIDQRAALDRAILGELDQLIPPAPASAAGTLRKIRERLAAFIQE